MDLIHALHDNFYSPRFPEILSVISSYFVSFLGPTSGPVVIKVVAKSSESLAITWDPLDADNANGVIINYAVCYQKREDNPANICAQNETVDGHDLNTTLNGLKKFTDFVVAVKASTKIGFGPVGRNKSAQTLQDSK